MAHQYLINYLSSGDDFEELVIGVRCQCRERRRKAVEMIAHNKSGYRAGNQSLYDQFLVPHT